MKINIYIETNDFMAELQINKTSDENLLVNDSKNSKGIEKESPPKIVKKNFEINKNIEEDKTNIVNENIKIKKEVKRKKEYKSSNEFFKILTEKISKLEQDDVPKILETLKDSLIESFEEINNKQIGTELKKTFDRIITKENNKKIVKINETNSKEKPDLLLYSLPDSLNEESLREQQRDIFEKKSRDSKKLKDLMNSLKEKYCDLKDENCIQNTLWRSVINLGGKHPLVYCKFNLEFSDFDFKKHDLGESGWVNYTKNGENKKFRFDEDYKNSFKYFIKDCQKNEFIWPDKILDYQIWQHDDNTIRIKFIVTMANLMKNLPEDSRRFIESTKNSSDKT